jgi:hypothetical protein
MKKIKNLSIVLLFLANLTFAQSPNVSKVSQAFSLEANPSPAINWEYSSYDFGKIPQGKPVTLTYNFTNTGNSPLIISTVNPSCGCTNAEFSKEAIAPGKKGFVRITFNAAAVGNFTKSLTVIANVSTEPIILTFKGEVTSDVAPQVISH